MHFANAKEVNTRKGKRVRWRWLRLIYLASLGRCAVAERGGHVNARALPFAHLDGKQKRNAVRKEGSEQAEGC